MVGDVATAPSVVRGAITAGRVAEVLCADGLAVTGWLALGNAVPSDGLAPGVQALALIGPDGPAMWAAFTAAPEFADGRAHPMDRWSWRVIGDAAALLEADAVFPTDGPPYPPFLSWAMRAEAAAPSPLGMVATPARGLMASWRGALAFRAVPDAMPAAVMGSERPVCAACAQPCATACPAGAFQSAGYDADACRAFLDTPEGAVCTAAGCLARRACPASLSLSAAQQAFHLAAFRKGGGGAG
ncbi:MAG: ferredoxin [Pseudomonadota bacterium]